MRLIDADRLLEERRLHLYYHLPNGDTAIPIIDIKHAPTVDNGGWIPVTEQMPQELEAVEIWLKYAKISITAFWMRNGDVADGFVWIVSEFERNRCYAGDVSHWRKPQPPKEGAGE